MRRKVLGAGEPFSAHVAVGLHRPRFLGVGVLPHFFCHSSSLPEAKGHRIATAFGRTKAYTD